MSGVDGSVGQPKASKPVSPGFDSRQFLIFSCVYKELNKR